MFSFSQPYFIRYHMTVGVCVTWIDSEVRIFLVINFYSSNKPTSSIVKLNVVVNLDWLVKGNIDWHWHVWERSILIISIERVRVGNPHYLRHLIHYLESLKIDACSNIWMLYCLKSISLSYLKKWEEATETDYSLKWFHALILLIF